MKHLRWLFILSILLSGCKGSGGGGAGATASAAPSCGSFTLGNSLVETTYSGTVVVTSGNCGDTYDIYSEVDEGAAGVVSVTGWRQINNYLDTSSGNINFTTGGRWQTAGSAQAESAGLQFGGVDHTTCQNAYGVNGQSDEFDYTVVAEFDSNCNPRLRGTFREYAICLNAQTVAICSGTITLTR